MREPNALKFRPASLDDKEILLIWRNDVDTRRFSFNQEAISEHQHVKWLTETLNNASSQLLIAEHHNEPIGTMRVDLTDEGNIVSWTIAPEFRGKDLAKRMVSLLVSQLKGKVFARIISENSASIKVAQFAGFKYIDTRDGVLYFEYQNSI